jgi:hypothetical protein
MTRTNVRIVIYFLCAILTAFITGSSDVDLGLMNWWEWLKFGSGILLAGLVTVRAFLDQTVARENGLPENEEKL